MRLLYIHQHFVTRQGSSGTRSYDVSAHWVSMGHQVTLICGRAEQSGLPLMPWWKPWQIHHFEGFKVIACNVPYSNKMSIPRRLWSIFGFVLLSTLAAVWQRRPDIVFATSPPLEVVVPGFVASRRHRVPFIFEVRDLWPEDLVDAGRIKRGGRGHRLQGLLERFAYRAAARVLLVSRGFHDRLLQRGYPDSLLRTVLLGGDGTMNLDVLPDRGFLQQLGLDGKFVAVYAGAHGVANGLDQVLDAADRLRHRSEIGFLFIGDGKQRPQLVERIQRQGLDNVRMAGAVPKLELPKILAACDVGLQILTQVSRPRWVTPNKLFDYMFAGLPTIVNFAGTAAELVEAEGAGTASQPGSADDLAARISYYADHPDECRRIGAWARQVAWAKFDRRSIAAQLIKIFEDVLAEKKCRKRS